jgi:hypothetical protein
MHKFVRGARGHAYRETPTVTWVAGWNDNAYHHMRNIWLMW